MKVQTEQEGSVTDQNVTVQWRCPSLMNPHKFHCWTKLSEHKEVTLRWFLFAAIRLYSGYMFYGSPISMVKFNSPNSVLNYTKFTSFSQLVNIPTVSTVCPALCWTLEIHQ